MKTLDLSGSFQEFKEFKNIDRETLMRILEEVFRTALAKRYGSEDNFDIIVNIDKGGLLSTKGIGIEQKNSKISEYIRKFLQNKTGAALRLLK